MLLQLGIPCSPGAPQLLLHKSKLCLGGILGQLDGLVGRQELLQLSLPCSHCLLHSCQLQASTSLNKPLTSHVRRYLLLLTSKDAGSDEHAQYTLNRLRSEAERYAPSQPDQIVIKPNDVCDIKGLYR